MARFKQFRIDAGVMAHVLAVSSMVLIACIVLGLGRRAGM